MCTCGLCGPFSCGCLPKTEQTLFVCFCYVCVLFFCQITLLFKCRLYLTLIFMQMADLKLTVEINYGGKFVWNPNLEYIGGNIAYEDVDPNCLSFFEIQGLCEKCTPYKYISLPNSWR